MGPGATVLYLERVAQLTRADRDQDHVNLICMQHSSIPDRTEYILDRSQPSPLPSIQRDIKILTALDVRFITLPCNTAHFFYEEVQAATELPVLNMIELAVAEVVATYPDADSIAVLATRGTMHARLYHREIERLGRVPLELPESFQHEMHDLIYGHLKAGATPDKSLYLDLLGHVSDAGADVSLVACTELSAIDRTLRHDYPTVDTLDALARETIRQAGKELSAGTEAEWPADYLARRRTNAAV